MLILTQHLDKPEDDIIIGDDIEIRFLGVVSNGTAVKIAITAPKHIPILRRSVRNKKENSNASSRA